MSMTMPRTERLQHYINQGYKEKSVLIRRVAETAGRVQAAKIADVLKGCKSGNVCRGKNVVFFFVFCSVGVEFPSIVQIVADLIINRGHSLELEGNVSTGV